MTELAIRNTHDQLVASGGGCAIVTASTPGRRSYPSGWAVYRVRNGRAIQTDPNGAWYENGRKTFRWFSTSKEQALEDAKAFVKSLTGYDGPWVRNRLRDWVPADVNKRFKIAAQSRVPASATAGTATKR